MTPKQRVKKKHKEATMAWVGYGKGYGIYIQSDDGKGWERIGRGASARKAWADAWEWSRKYSPNTASNRGA